MMMGWEEKREQKNAYAKQAVNDLLEFIRENDTKFYYDDVDKMHLIIGYVQAIKEGYDNIK